MARLSRRLGRPPFLFGTFTIADAMYAPVVMRFVTYAPPLSKVATGYVERMLAVPAAAWVDKARHETLVFSVRGQFKNQ